MARDKQINFRVSQEEVRRFHGLAQHYGVSVSVMIRIVVSEKHKAIAAIRDAGLGPEHEELLDALSEPRADLPLSSAELAVWIHKQGRDAGWRGYGTVLSELQELGFLRRLPAGYTLTAKGEAYVRSRGAARSTRT
jgi:hypothetical protein